MEDSEAQEILRDKPGKEPISPSEAPSRETEEWLTSVFANSPQEDPVVESPETDSVEDQLRKKEHSKVSEKRRRSRLNDRFEILKSLMEFPEGKQISKEEILTQAITSLRRFKQVCLLCIMHYFNIYLS